MGVKVLAALAAVTGIGLGSYVAHRLMVPRRTAPIAPPPGPGPVTPVRNYVGSGWTGWPHKDVFPDADAIVQAFLRLGYGVDDNLLSYRSMNEIGRFQQHYNLWSRTWYAFEDTDPWPEEPASPGQEIEVDELVGTATVEALYDALLADEAHASGWQDLVEWYASQQ